jgi:shikimate dehydrogenase
VREISGTTRIFGVLAHPVHQVKAPQLINRLLERIGFDGVMVPIHVQPDGFAALVEALRQMRNLDGFVVTVPHKTSMPALCDELTPPARLVEAVNIVRRHADGRLSGGILDGDGFVSGLRGEGIEPAGLDVYMAGAGGAASAIAVALASAGVSRLTIANRTASKAQALAERLSDHFPSIDFAVGTGDPRGHALVINATSLGLQEDDPLPLEADRLAAGQIVAEIIMKPACTRLLSIATQRGCRIQYGEPMLAAQIELMAAFMGVPLPATTAPSPSPNLR